MSEICGTGGASAVRLIPHPTDRWVRVEVWNSNVFFDTLIGAVNIALADCPSRPVRTWQQLDGGGLIDISMAIVDHSVAAVFLSVDSAASPAGQVEESRGR